MQISRFEIEGARELDRMLQRLGTEVATEIGVDALKASASALAEQWRAVAPYDPGHDPQRKYGHLKQEIRFRRVGTDKATVIAFHVTTGRAFWAFFYEFGTVNQPPRPTFRPAAETMRDELVTIQVNRLRAGIEAVARTA